MFNGSASSPKSVPLSRIASFALALLVVAAATDAAARPKKQRAERTPASATMCDGTPIIMQGMECVTRPAHAEKQGQVAKRAGGPRLSVRGSSGVYIPPVQRAPSLTLA